MSNITLYGFDFSLYTGRVRSYFIKAGLSYSERATNELAAFLGARFASVQWEAEFPHD